MCKIVETHVCGKRRTKVKMRVAEPVIGNLYLYDWHAGNASNRNLRVANLRETACSLERSLLAKLFDATVVKITASGIHIVGFQIQSVESFSTEYLQGWWAKPAR